MQFCLSFGQLLNFHPKIWTRGRSKYDIPSGPWLICEFSPHNTFFCPLMVSLTWLETIGSRVTWPDKRLETCSFPSLPRILKISNQPSPLVKSFPHIKNKKDIFHNILQLLGMREVLFSRFTLSDCLSPSPSPASKPPHSLPFSLFAFFLISDRDALGTLQSQWTWLWLWWKVWRQ